MLRRLPWIVTCRPYLKVKPSKFRWNVARMRMLHSLTKNKCCHLDSSIGSDVQLDHCSMFSNTMWPKNEFDLNNNQCQDNARIHSLECGQFMWKYNIHFLNQSPDLTPQWESLGCAGEGFIQWPHSFIINTRSWWKWMQHWLDGDKYLDTDACCGQSYSTFLWSGYAFSYRYNENTFFLDSDNDLGYQEIFSLNRLF